MATTSRVSENEISLDKWNSTKNNYRNSLKQSLQRKARGCLIPMDPPWKPWTCGMALEPKQRPPHDSSAQCIRIAFVRTWLKQIFRTNKASEWDHQYAVNTDWTKDRCCTRNCSKTNKMWELRTFDCYEQSTPHEASLRCSATTVLEYWLQSWFSNYDASIWETQRTWKSCFISKYWLTDFVVHTAL